MSQAVALAVPLPIPRAFLWHVPRRLGGRALIAFVAFLVVGNLAIQGVSLLARSTMAGDRIEGVDGVGKLRAVDGEVWRGAHPSRSGYRELAAAGVTVVVDLRAEDDAAEDDAYIERLGLQVVHLPIRDGQTPSSGDVDQFLSVVRESPGTVFVHCGAGVGRTGAMVAAYLMATDQAGGPGAVLGRNLAVGPPSLEQIVFATNGGDEPGAVVKAVSRTLDAPRRILAIL